MFSRLNRFLGNIFNRNKTTLTEEDINGIQLFADNTDIREINRLSKEFFRSILQNEALSTEFKNVISVKTPLKTDPRYIEVLPGEQLTFRTVIVTPDGFVWTIEAAFKTGEQWSFDRLKSILRNSMFDNYNQPEGYSAWIDSAVTREQYYIRTFEPIQP